MFSMRPAKVLHVLELARAIPWEAVERACGRLDLASAEHDVWRIAGYQDFEWILTTYIGWMERAAAMGRGLIVLASI